MRFQKRVLNVEHLVQRKNGSADDTFTLIKRVYMQHAHIHTHNTGVHQQDASALPDYARVCKYMYMRWPLRIRTVGS